MCEHLVQPLQGAIQVQLDPAGGAGHRLPPGRAEPDVRDKQRGGDEGVLGQTSSGRQKCCCHIVSRSQI